MRGQRYKLTGEMRVAIVTLIWKGGLSLRAVRRITGATRGAVERVYWQERERLQGIRRIA